MRHRMPTFFALTLLLGSAAFGQPAEVAGPPESAALANELARLNATLADIKVLLERVTQAQGVDLLMKRMELSSAQVVEIEKQLRSAETERAAIEDERVRMEMNLQVYEAELEGAGTDASPERLEAFTAQHDTEMGLREARVRSLDDEIAVLRNRLTTKQRELEDWQDYVDRRLGGV